MNTPLKPFIRRVRVARAWKGAAIGLVFGAGGASVLAALDWFRVAYTEPVVLGALGAGGVILGALLGALWPVAERAVGASVDRRAHLDDRLSTALTGASEGEFGDAQRVDAWAKVDSLSPKRLYPIRFGRWHAGGASLALLAATLFLLGNTPLLMSDAQRKAKTEMLAKAQEIERVVKEEIEPAAKAGKLSEAEKRLADELRRLQQEMERARMDKTEALQRSEELSRKADELMRKRAEASEQNLLQAETAFQKLLKDEMTKAGIQNPDPSMAQMSDAEMANMKANLDARMQQLQQQAKALQSAMNTLQNKMANPNLSAEERKKLEEQMKSLQKEMEANRQGLEQARKDMQALQLSQEAQETFRKIMQDPRFQELQKLAQQLQANAQAGQQGEAPKLSQEQLEEMRRKLEALAKELNDPEKLAEYLEALRRAIEEGMGQCRNGQCAGIGFGGLGLPIPGMPGPGGMDDRMAANSGVVPKTDKPTPGQGKTTATQIVGQRQATGPEQYIEIKAPTTVGTRSSVPYVKVLPQYRKRAESAIEKDQIPKEHQRRVQQYFDSLTGGKK